MCLFKNIPNQPKRYYGILIPNNIRRNTFWQRLRRPVAEIVLSDVGFAEETEIDRRKVRRRETDVARPMVAKFARSRKGKENCRSQLAVKCVGSRPRTTPGNLAMRNRETTSDLVPYLSTHILHGGPLGSTQL